MKKVFFAIAIFAVSIASTFAQNEKLQMALGKNLGQFATAKTADDYKNLANAFARIANAEPNEWLPKYYAAQCRLLAGYKLLQQDMNEAQSLAKTALTEIEMAEKLAPTESEILTLKAFTYQLQLIENPMVNGAKFSPMIFEALAKAEAMNPENPRVYMIRGDFTRNMPEFYGGGLEKATPDIQKAVEKIGTFKPASPVHPNWGKEYIETMAKLLEKKEVAKGK